VGWTQAALDHLESYAFPGNVRELKGLVERAVLLCEGDALEVGHFSLSLAEPPPEDNELNLRERLEKVERSLLLDCLRKHDGNQTLAARELGLPRRTLLYRLGRLNIRSAIARADRHDPDTYSLYPRRTCNGACLIRTWSRPHASPLLPGQLAGLLHRVRPGRLHRQLQVR
jgi:hypothetical protein